jgi:hypothetical protein
MPKYLLQKKSTSGFDISNESRLAVGVIFCMIFATLDLDRFIKNPVYEEAGADFLPG